jgi:hypothetical protein
VSEKTQKLYSPRLLSWTTLSSLVAISFVESVSSFDKPLGQEHQSAAGQAHVSV